MDEASTSEIKLADAFGRVIEDLRISVTDRCNFRCLYCLPETEAAANFYMNRGAAAPSPDKPIYRSWVKRTQILSFEEITRVCEIGARLGIRKIRITGGEPLLRRDLTTLIESISKIPGIEDIALTTNGFGFIRLGDGLKSAGLKRITFSLDSLERENFKRITGIDGLEEVKKGINLALKLNLQPVKINAVLIRGVNDHEIEALIQYAKDLGAIVRFIEFMPLDSRRAWQRDLVVPANEILETAKKQFQLVPINPTHPSETARSWGFENQSGGIGLISPITEPFCGNCNRLRLTADGQIRTCLFSQSEHNLKRLLRNGSNDEKITDWLRATVWGKEKGHHVGSQSFSPPARSMSWIGG